MIKVQILSPDSIEDQKEKRSSPTIEEFLSPKSSEDQTKKKRILPTICM